MVFLFIMIMRMNGMENVDKSFPFANIEIT